MSKRGILRGQEWRFNGPVASVLEYFWWGFLVLNPFRKGKAPDQVFGTFP